MGISFRRVVVLSTLLISCGPLGPFPGGPLGGQLASTPPSDWSFTESYKTIQLEVRPNDPYSVNVWCTTTGSSLYIGAGRGSSSVWARSLLDDPRARVQIGSTLYDVSATRVTDDAEIQAYLETLSAKYDASEAQVSDFRPDRDERAAAILFRLERSEP